jgi:hypothetical protein
MNTRNQVRSSTFHSPPVPSSFLHLNGISILFSNLPCFLTSEYETTFCLHTKQTITFMQLYDKVTELHLDICNTRKPPFVFQIATRLPHCNTAYCYCLLPDMTHGSELGMTFLFTSYLSKQEIACCHDYQTAPTNVYTNDIYRCPQKATGRWQQLDKPVTHSYFM